MLRIEIRELMHQFVLSPSVIDKIEKSINNNSPILKGFKFEHCDNCDNIIDFTELNFSNVSLGKALSGASYIYSHYSAHSHPSFIGVKHFEEMYYDKDEYIFMKEILEYTYIYLGRFMTDFCKYKDSYHPFYNQEESNINNILTRIMQIQQNAEL